MEYKNFFKWLELTYRIDINSELRSTLEEHFGENLNIYTDQDLYEQTRKIIQTYKDKYVKCKIKLMKKFKIELMKYYQLLYEHMKLLINE